MYLLAYLEFFQGNEDKCYWSARFLFDRQKVVIADHHDRERWKRYFEPWYWYFEVFWYLYHTIILKSKFSSAACMAVFQNTLN